MQLPPLGQLPAGHMRPPRLGARLAQHMATLRGLSLAILVVSLVLLIRLLPVEPILDSARREIDHLGVWGPVALGGLYVAATLLLLPGAVLTCAAGAMYGLVLGTVVVSLASTTGAALAFLIARHLARQRVRKWLLRSPRLAAVDQAIGREGWKIVALLRLSPAIPFNLQNYLYGVTAIRFWPCVLVSWATMLPGTFLYVYLGAFGRAVGPGEPARPAPWALQGVGLLATLLATLVLARLARRAIQAQTAILIPRGAGAPSSDEAAFLGPIGGQGAASDEQARPWGTLLWAGCATAALALTGWSFARRERVRAFFESQLRASPTASRPHPGKAAIDPPTRGVTPRGAVDRGGGGQAACTGPGASV